MPPILAETHSAFIFISTSLIFFMIPILVPNKPILLTPSFAFLFIYKFFISWLLPSNFPLKHFSFVFSIVPIYK